MVDIHLTIGQLADIISNTLEFKQLKTSLTQINQDNNLRKMLTDFEAKQNKYYTSELPQGQSQQLAAELTKEFDNLNKYPLINQYFSASNIFNQKLSEIIRRLNEALDSKLQ